MEVKETLLPGVGLCYEFNNADGDRVGVIAHRRGDFEVLVYAGADPDKARRVFRLTEKEADALAQILGAPRMVERFADLTKEVPGLEAGQIEVGSASPYTERPLGETRARTRTGPRSSRSCATSRYWRRPDPTTCCVRMMFLS